MKISEIIAHVGDENITVQNIAANMTAVNCGKQDAKVTFVTSRSNGQELAREAAGITSQTIALVLWMPKNKLPQIEQGHDSEN